MKKIKTVFIIVSIAWSIVIITRIALVSFFNPQSNSVSIQWGWFLLAVLLLIGNGILISSYFILRYFIKR